MKKWVTFLFICFLANSFSQTNISPQFSELKGMEDQLGNTILFYRIFQDSSWNEIYFFRTNHIYKFNVETGVDNFFLYDYNFETEGGMEHFNIYDIDFWDSDPDKFIYCGHAGIFDSHTFVFRFDEPTINFFPGWIGSVNKIELSTNNDSLISLGCWANFAGVYIRTSKSIDGGYNWSTISDSLQLLAVKPDNGQVLFCYNDNGYIANYNGDLYKSTNGGINFYLVDTLKKYPSAENDEIVFDANASNIFRIFETMYGDFVLRISLNNGEALSWQTKYSSDSKIFISIDETTSGTIYLADKKNILVSTDYGNSFSLYKTLERKIVGIYKKPNSNKLYAATKYNIYEITPDTIQVIKSLPIPEDAFAWFPLNLDDMWVSYHEEISNVGDTSKYFLRSEVAGYKIFDSKVYIKELQTTLPVGGTLSIENSFNYFRIDSANGFVFRAQFQNDSTLWFESFLMDLIAEVGDTIPFSFGTVLESEEPIIQFGVSSSKRTFRVLPSFGQQFELVKGFGLVYDTVWTSINYAGRLLGCVIDGVIYGDTLTVGVEDEENLNATSFILEQNYPNPFNPTTKIKFTIPGRTEYYSVPQIITLKVYDVLGNEIATLVNEEKPTGEYEVEFNPESSIKQPASGIYFYQLKAGSFIQTKKMLMIK
jgi:hypothetical protein